MKKIVLVLFAFCILSSLTKLTAQCDPPSNIWDEDGITLHWSSVDTATSYVVRYRVSGTFAFTEVEVDLDTSFSIGALGECVEYDFRVKTNCGDLSSSFSPIHEAYINCGTCYEEYCEVPDIAFDDLAINYFRFNDVINDFEIFNESYEDFRGDYERVAIPEQEIEIELEFSSFFIEMGQLDIYIDYNRNLEFDPNEHIINAQIDPNETYINTFVVPPLDELNFGLSRMRVVLTDNTTEEIPPCETEDFILYGEVEEYCIVIGQLPSACDFGFNIDLKSVGSDGVTFEWDPLPAAQGYNYRYKKTSEDDSEWEELATVQNTAFLDELDECEEYEFEIRSVCPSDTSSYRNNIVFNSYCSTSTNEIEWVIGNVTFYPNPWTSSLNISLEAKQSNTISVYAHNLHGQRFVLQDKNNINVGNNLISIDNVSHLNSGVYIIEIVDENNNRQVHKTLKIQ